MNPNLPEPTSAVPPAPPDAPAALDGNGAVLEIPPEYIPYVDDLVIEDGKPVESIFVEKQYRLLTEPLYSSWPGQTRP